MTDTSTITRKLHECRDSDDPAAAFDLLVPLVYDDLKTVARQQLRRLRPGQTLSTTALVNDSYTKLRQSANLDWTDRRHFFAVAARAMRQIIVDQARSQLSGRKSGVTITADFDAIPDNLAVRADQLIYINQLLEQLQQINPDLVQVFECRYYAGFTQEEIAATFDISLRTTQRRWHQACAWLRELATANA